MRKGIALMLLAGPAAAQTIQPGQWQTTSTVQQMEMPGMPAGLAGLVKRKPTTISNCVTPEQAKAGPQEMLKSAPECRFTRFSMAGGKYASEMVCARGGMTTTATSTGTYSATSLDAVSRIVGTGDHQMKMTVAVSGRRVGECR